MKFPDAAYYGSIAAFNAVMAHEGCDDFAYYIGGNIALHPWNAPDVKALRSGNRRGMGIHVSTVVGRNGASDGAYFADWNRSIYGAGDGDRMCWDLEPSIYRANPAESLAYGRAWAAAVRAAGFSPVIYSTPDGCAAIGDKGYDAIWAARPGQPDPTKLFAASFFPGLIAVQWGQGTWGGVTYDLSTSQFGFIPSGPGRGGGGTTTMTREGWAALFRFMFVLLMRNPDDTGLKDPVSGDVYWEHYYWADRMLNENPDLVMIDFLVSASGQEAVTLPLTPQPGPAGPPGKDGSVDVNAVLAEAARRLSAAPPAAG